MQLKLIAAALAGASSVAASADVKRTDKVTSVVVVDYFPAQSVSTVYATSSFTIYDCPASVSSCPVTGTPSIYTSMVSVSTTICPLTLTSITTTAFAPSSTLSNVPGALPPTGSSEAGAATTSASEGTGGPSSGLSTIFNSWTSTITIGTSSASLTSTSEPSSSAPGSDTASSPPTSSPADSTSVASPAAASSPSSGAATSSPADATAHTSVHSTVTVTSTTQITLPASTQTISSSVPGSDSSMTGIANNATMPSESTVAPSTSAPATPSAPYSYGPGAAGATGATSSSLAGAVGATGTGAGTAATSYPGNNGTVTAPSATASPFTGTAMAQEMDSKMLLCFVIGIVSAVLLI
ncbi:hypothetical protein D0864_07477 [Hortaea werneckii]|uniref:Uncharacterized protein n=1 Tax=Hortaea werneckii TaxID=91943 RepID=A0A3M7F815_HORWE|nr:hypothetical protein KC338_g9077 [Hortaea werneckii]KAI6867138.1 hypothetical protein KC323_g3655 [Hortaea werneckii]KAI7347259.1 hypothetical protein KC320_g7367 [Hortaea werneckii]RMY84767.1 hypothetical protein D0864_07477 [Hortaea werneckii]